MSILNTAKKLGVAGALALSLAACSPAFKGDVATFHDLPPSGVRGEKVALVPAQEEHANSLEYAHYAGIISRELVRTGFQDAGAGEPDLLVTFDVGVSDGREKVYSRPGPGFVGGFGFSRFGCFGCFGGGFGGGFGFGNNDIRSRTVYNVELRIQIRTPDGDPIWEGRVESDVRGNDLTDYVPVMARAIFKKFPGKSGTTTKVVLEHEDVEDLVQEGR